MPPTPDHRLPSDPTGLTRRGFLAAGAGAAGAVLLAACSSGDATRTVGGGDGASAYLVNRFDPNTFAVLGGEQRLVFSLLAPDGSPLADAPAELRVSITRDGQAVGEPMMVKAHKDAIPIPYYPVRFTPTQTGVHLATATLNGGPISQRFKVSDSSAVPKVGGRLPAVDTPTTADNRGVDPICTRSPAPCGFHEHDLRPALSSGRPTVLLVSTPAFCQIGVCGPVLELVTEIAGGHSGVQVIHTEVYKSREPSPDNLAPIMSALSLDYEPALFAVDASGTIVERLDTVFDRTEITAAFAALA